MAKRLSRYYFKLEKKIMDMLGLIATKGSGSGWLEKEDGYNDAILAQLKTTEDLSYSIKLEDINKLEHHANVSNLTPAFVIHFIGKDETYIVCKVEDLKKVAEGLNNELYRDTKIPDDWKDILD